MKQSLIGFFSSIDISHIFFPFCLHLSFSVQSSYSAAKYACTGCGEMGGVKLILAAGCRAFKHLVFWFTETSSLLFKP